MRTEGVMFPVAVATGSDGPVDEAEATRRRNRM